MAMKWLIAFAFIFVILTTIGQITEGSFGNSNIVTFQTATEHFSMISTTDWLGSISNIVRGLGDVCVAIFNMVALNYSYLNQGTMQILGWIIRALGVVTLIYFILDVKTSL